MSLSWRLTLSYILIILVTLALTFITLLLFSRPSQSRLVSLRLVTQSRQAGRTLNTLYRQSASTEHVLAQFTTVLADGSAHLIWVDPQGVIQADNQQAWLGQPFPLPEATSEPRNLGSETFTAPGGQIFLYESTSIGPANNPVGYVVALLPQSAGLPTLLRELGRGLGMAGLVAGLISVLIGLFIARAFVLPLQRLVQAAGAVAAGHYQHRLPESGPPEIKRVAASFNVMAGQVEAGQQAIRDFVSNVSHELKTPLTSIQGFSQAIMEDATPDEAARRRAAGIIYQEAARMSRLVEDLLDLARLDSGQVVMQKTPLDMARILDSAVERLLPQAAKQKVKLTKEWKTLPKIVGDGDRLAQVFTNFLDNAIRHTPTGGRVTIKATLAKGLPRPRRHPANPVRPDAPTSISERGDFVEISVADTGVGIPAEELPRIFERFYQVEKSRKRGRGTGLGLAISKEIIEAHGGSVRAESVEGVGAKFTVLLPVTEADVQTLISRRPERKH